MSWIRSGRLKGPKNVEKLGGACKSDERIYGKVRDQELR